MKVKKLEYNWRQIGDLNDGLEEDVHILEVGKQEVSEIIENEPHNGLQQWNYLIKMNNGSAYRVFNPNFVEYFRNN